MSMNGIFKQNMRTGRQTSIELDFTGGMKFTDTPLDENVHRLLVNFDVSADTTAITPRAAIRKYKDIEIDLTQFTDPTQYTLPTLVHVQDNPGKDPSLIYTGLGALPNLTIAKGDRVYRTDGKGPKLKKFNSQVMHNMITPDGDNLYDDIGTKAFGGNYYYLEADEPVPALPVPEIISYIDMEKLDASGDIVPTVIVPKDVNPTEATTYGYNMLQKEPYNFTDTAISGQAQLLGMMPHAHTASGCGDILLNPQMNTDICFRVYYKAPAGAEYEVIWETRDAAADAYVTLDTQHVTITETEGILNQIFVSTIVPTETYMVRVSFFKKEGAAYSDITEAAMVSGFSFDPMNKTSLANLKLETYDLSTATGMAFWNNKLILYGCAKDPTVLFVSYTNDPGYFPYPNNVDTFDEAIVYVLPFLDDLLVFTSSQVWRLIMAPTGMGWNKQLIQNNLRINPFDTGFIQVVKNMVFFKSGNYFYMIVPKAKSLTGELTLAPISRPLMGFFDDFRRNITDTLNELYLLQSGTNFTIQNVYNYLDYEDVHNVYVFTSTSSPNYVNVDMIYNTVGRYWRMHCYESTNPLNPALADATRPGNLVSVSPLNATTDTIKLYLRDNLVVPDETLELGAATKFKNWQMLDTGYHDYLLNRNKRFREVQLRFNNISGASIDFGLEFLIDGRTRRDMFDYEPVYVDSTAETIRENPVPEGEPIIRTRDFNTLLLNRTLKKDMHLVTPSETRLGTWSLDGSHFPSVHLTKVRVPVSGKGYAPRFKLIAQDDYKYELLGYAWVYRMMNSR